MSGKSFREVGAVGGKSFRAVGTAVNNDRTKMQRNLQARQHMLQTSMKLLETDPHKKKDLEKMKSFVKRQVDERLKGHPPTFTRCVSIIQLVIMAVMMAIGEIAPWGLGVEKKEYTVKLFAGETTQPITVPENPYYGPKVETLVDWGSKWAPCMRTEKRSEDFVEQQAELQDTMGCCSNALDDSCGMMTPDDCDFFGGTFMGVGTSCIANSPPCASITVRPCCFGIFGQCAIITENHCNTIGGFWQEDKEVCDGNECLFRECGMGYKYYEKNIFGYSHPNQFYRFVSATFLHVGVIHVVMNCLGQYVMVAQVEFVAGFWRTAIMYIISGVGGFMISALFSAELMSNGASAAIYGMLGVEAVDLFYTWQLIDDKAAQLFGLIVKLILFLGIGTLPYIDNFAHVGGFLTGIVVGLCFLPFIFFSKMDLIRKRMAQFLSIIGLAALILGLLYVFYTSGEITCKNCQYIDCVPYTSKICSYETGSSNKTLLD